MSEYAGQQWSCRRFVEGADQPGGVCGGVLDDGLTDRLHM
jgi:hypothetical protein